MHASPSRNPQQWTLEMLVSVFNFLVRELETKRTNKKPTRLLTLWAGGLVGLDGLVRLGQKKKERLLYFSSV